MDGSPLAIRNRGMLEGERNDRCQKHHEEEASRLGDRGGGQDMEGDRRGRRHAQLVHI
jgi:hypothetical protein